MIPLQSQLVPYTEMQPLYLIVCFSFFPNLISENVTVFDFGEYKQKSFYRQLESTISCDEFRSHQDIEDKRHYITHRFRSIRKGINYMKSHGDQKMVFWMERSEEYDLLTLRDEALFKKHPYSGRTPWKLLAIRNRTADEERELSAIKDKYFKHMSGIEGNLTPKRCLTIFVQWLVTSGEPLRQSKDQTKRILSQGFRRIMMDDPCVTIDHIVKEVMRLHALSIKIAKAPQTDRSRDHEIKMMADIMSATPSDPKSLSVRCYNVLEKAFTNDF